MLDLTKLSLSAACGVLSHLFVFKRGEWHTKSPRLVLLWLLSIVLTLAYETVISRVEFWSGLRHGLVYLLLYHIFLIGSLLIYRGLWHPLRHFSGPRAASLSKLWHLYYNISSQNHLFLDNLYKQYGTFIRTGPNELTIYCHEAFEAMDGRGSLCQKSVWHDILLPEIAINSTRVQAEHDWRRRTWLRAFSTNALQEYDQRVNRHAILLENRIAELSASGVSVDVLKWFHWFTIDVMGDLTFSKSFRMLENGESHRITGLLHDSLEIVGLLSPVPWLVRIGVDLLPGLPVVRKWQELVKLSRELIDERKEKSGELFDISHWLIDQSKRDTQENVRWLYGDSVSAIIAGSDSVAGALVCVFYELASSHESQLKLAAEVKDIDVFDRKTLNSLPYLNGVINETLRLHPPVPTHGSRVAPPEGITIAGQFIPGGTTLVAPRYTIGRLPSYFDRPEDFVPERWYSMPEMIRDKRAFMPFNQGRYGCIGKNLAISELQIVIVLLISKYYVRFAPGEDGSRVLGEMMDRFTILPGPLNLIFEKRASKTQH